MYDADKCRCTLAHKLTGSGCRYCQPQEYINELHQQLDDEREESEREVAFWRGKYERENVQADIFRELRKELISSDVIGIDCAPGEVGRAIANYIETLRGGS